MPCDASDSDIYTEFGVLTNKGSCSRREAIRLLLTRFGLSPKEVYRRIEAVRKPVNDLAADCRCVRLLDSISSCLLLSVPARPTRARSAVAKQRRVTEARSSKKKTADRSRRAVAESTRRAAFGRHEVGPCPDSTGTAARHRSSSRSPHTTRRLPSTKRGFVPFRSTISRRQPSSSAP